MSVNLRWASLAAVCASLMACNSGGRDVQALSDTTDAGPAPSQEWKSYGRDEDYSATSTISGYIPMRDGVELFYSVSQPADSDGNPVPGPFPTILTQTGYNVDVPVIPAVNDYLIKRGYAHVSVDVRGTGNSGGNWDAFGEDEQADYGEVIAWVAEQEFCDGNVGTWGASFMAITQLFTSAHAHPAHKAMFTIVPMADAYRDIVFTGGQTNIGFIPLWMGLVTGLTVVPTANTFADPAAVLPNLVNDTLNATTGFQVPIIANAVLGEGETVYDGPFWRTRSTIEYLDNTTIPTFIVGGLNDIFQRGEPLLYERLKNQATTKLLIGPWTHVDGSSGAGLPLDGVPDINSLALQWFDEYLRDIDTQAAKMPNVTQYYYGAEEYRTAADWPHPDAKAQRWYLREGGVLSQEMPAAGEAGTSVLQLPVNGICSASSSQWTAGVLGATGLPCVNDNRINELLLESTFTSVPMAEDYTINGPIQADIWIEPTAAVDVGVSVKITLVGEDGSSREITNGLLSARHRAVDPELSRFLDGEMIQPWHPFTEEAESATPAQGEAVLLNVEVFPTSFVVPAGSQLRVAIGASDFPHGLPPLTDLADQLVGVYTLLTDEEHASSVVLSVLPTTGQ
ncbi:MAG: CocE/NonD family hydrolase [Oceanococcus sp.]